MQVQTTPQASKFHPAAALRPAATGRMPAGIQMVLHKGEELFAEGDESEFFYQVVSGAIRTYKPLSDGRRQIEIEVVVSPVVMGKDDPTQRQWRNPVDFGNEFADHFLGEMGTG